MGQGLSPIVTPILAGRSCMTILTMARYEWFEEWAGTRAKHRGPDYQQYKLAIAQRLLERALQRFPHLRDKVTGVPTVSPATWGAREGGCAVETGCSAGMGGCVGMGGLNAPWGWGPPSELGYPTGMGAQWKWGAQWGPGVPWEQGALCGWDTPWEWGAWWDGVPHRVGVPHGHWAQSGHGVPCGMWCRMGWGAPWVGVPGGTGCPAGMCVVGTECS